MRHSVTPDFHVEYDPRLHKLKMMRRPQKHTTYLLCPTCHPMLFTKLHHHRVMIWHKHTDDDYDRQFNLVRDAEPKWHKRTLCDGTNIDMRSIPVALELGFRKFELHGFDCSFQSYGQ